MIVVQSDLASAMAASIPIEHFFRRPALSQPTLSPDGSKIAMLVPGPDGRNALAVAEVSDPSKRTGIARFSDADIRSVAWVNDRRLVMSLIDLQAPLGEQVLGGLYAIDADGSDFVFLVGRGRDVESTGHAAIRPLRGNHALFALLDDGSDDIVVQRFNFLEHGEDPGSTTLLRLNTITRATRTLAPDAPPNVGTWVLDRTGQPRSAVSNSFEGRVRTYYREPNSDAWVLINESDGFDPAPGDFVPLGISHDGKLIVSSIRDDPARTNALYHYDVTSRKRADKPFLALQGFDTTVGERGSQLVFDKESRVLLGVGYLSDAAGTAWLDDDMRRLQERIDAVLPGTNNLISCSASCKSQKRYIVTAYSDRQPSVYFLFDPTVEGRSALSLIGASRPWIDAATMATQDFARIKARDGLEFPAYVTRPNGKGPFPTVVLVHGGPFVRGHQWGWGAEGQFLASRGYLVIEAEYRGSRGYGERLFRAGWKQWGLAMQDDLTDATRWAISKGLADPKRVVIAGASYGGYATMMGLVKDPDLYRAGIDWVGVTDISLMYDIGWSDFAGSTWQRYGMPRLVGDREKDRAQLDATSPLKRAAEITKPVLMAYGTEDMRVPLPHGTRMRDALRAAGRVEVEWVTYPQEGHGFLLEKNTIDFWSRVERFLTRHAQ